ncbi:hypothetical protein GCM10010123_43490 [Pilimelia anulata]|uniref:Polysaccharide chain length determinant N-terminal domain-containing protein n=1 Tax=Pilimelia anulata TaxID=53371 RepID=A0A8J3FCM8_9ACTN|nr:Wzz/FepE/Etk N-terminal domain-containing protein [Pilimelia anulata]GGK08934.1 hypothetical protein GCM10010123_43490 [Pilimelia anulata]
MNSSHPAEPPEPEGPDLAAYLRWLRRHWWVIALGAVAGVAGAYGLILVQTPVYRSTTQVVVRAVEIGDKGNNNQNKVNLDTEAQVVRSLVVAEKARAAMGSAIPADALVKVVSVGVPPNSQVLNVTFAAPDPRAARAGAAAFATAYLDLRGAEARKRVDDERRALDSQISTVTKRLDRIADEIAAAGRDSSERERAIADRNVLTDQLRALNEQRNPLIAAAVHPGEVISEARLPADPSSPDTTLYLASGLAAGLLLGLLAALAADRFDGRVRRPRDLAERFDVPVLMEAPGQVSALGIVAPNHPLAREIGRLRNVLLATGQPRPGRGRLVLVTAASTGPSAAFLVANLAAAYARTGQQVAVVCAVPRSALAAITGTPAAGPGLAGVLRRDLPVLQALTPLGDLPALRLLPPGDLDAAAELPLAVLREALDALLDRFDHVLIEAASPHVSVEAQALAGDADAVLVVAEARRTRRTEVAAAITRFAQVGARVTGTVLAPRMPEVPPPPAGPAAAPPPVDRTVALPPGPAVSPPPPADDSTMILPRMVDVKPTPPATESGVAAANGRPAPRQLAPEAGEDAR